MSLLTTQEKLSLCLTILKSIYIQTEEGSLKSCKNILECLIDEWDQAQAEELILKLAVILTDIDNIRNIEEIKKDISLVRKKIKEEIDARKPNPEYTDKPLEPPKPKKQRKAKHG